MLEEIRRHAREESSFAFETSLSGRTYLRMIRKWRADGYHVTLIFLSLGTPEEAIRRVRARVRQGGHDVPEHVIRRRFVTGWRNFKTIYRQAVDERLVYDNSGATPVLLQQGMEDQQ